MRKIVNESIQVIHIGPNTYLTSNAILYALQRAQSNRMYAKFYTDKFFIQVNFMRDGSISVASNIRSTSFLQDLWHKERQGWTISSVRQFVFQWMQLSRRTLY